jgi:hypothetical protein
MERLHRMAERQRQRVGTSKASAPDLANSTSSSALKALIEAFNWGAKQPDHPPSAGQVMQDDFGGNIPSHYWFT